MSLATIEQIRDRLLTVIEGITPTSLSGDKFRRHRAERDGDLVAWAEKNPAACLRRAHARSRGDDSPPSVSSVNEERVQVTIELRAAYPQTHRYGGANALDRDDVIEQDWLKINKAVGLYGRANFTSATDGQYDCVPLGGDKEIDRGSGGVDFLVVRLRYEFVRAIS